MRAVGDLVRAPWDHPQSCAGLTGRVIHPYAETPLIWSERVRPPPLNF
jgi:hypothetical protein